MAVIMEQISKNRIIQSPSFCSILGFYACAITLLTSLPFEVSKPVLSANPIQHFMGGFGMVSLI